MSGILALKIADAERRIAALECSYRVYREGHRTAADRVAARLDAAYLELSRLEAEAGR